MPRGAEDTIPRYKPRNPINTSLPFPAQPPAILQNPALFEKLSVDTLFFAFYQQQNSFQQFLAAKQLKHKSWRFHTQYKTWFQRHEEPKAISDDYEQGTYLFFDYQTGWRQAIREDFRFDYSFLADDEATS